MAYPLRSLFRTGVTLAMFTLVVFTLVVGTVVSVSFMNAWNDTDVYGGGFDVRAVAAPATPVAECGADARARHRRARERFRAHQSIVPLEATPGGDGPELRALPGLGLDDAFLAHTTYDLAAVADGYGSPAESGARSDGARTSRSSTRWWRRGATGSTRELSCRTSSCPGSSSRTAASRPCRSTSVTRRRGKTLRLTVIGVLQEVVPESMARHLDVAGDADRHARRPGEPDRVLARAA